MPTSEADKSSQNQIGLLNAAEAAEYLSVAEQTVRQWASMGKLPKVKLRGKSLRFCKEDLDQIIDEDRITARPQ